MRRVLGVGTNDEAQVVDSFPNTKQEASSPKSTRVIQWTRGPRYGLATRIGSRHAVGEDRAVAGSLGDLVRGNHGDGDASGTSGVPVIMDSDDDLFAEKDKLEQEVDNEEDEEEAFLESVQVGLVVDGHGGSGCAEFVHSMLPHVLAKALRPEVYANVESVCRDAFDEVDKAFEDESRASRDTSGACATLVLTRGARVVVAHCGDARAVLCVGGEVRVLTKDHRADNEAEADRVLRAGGEIVNRRIDGVLSPSRAFGDYDLKSRALGALVSVPDVMGTTIRFPSVEPTQPQFQWDFLILATDGVWDVVSNGEACDLVGRSLARYGDPSAAARRLVEAAAHNPDDISVIVMVIRGPSGSSFSSFESRSSSTSKSFTSLAPSLGRRARFMTRMKNFVSPTASPKTPQSPPAE